MHDFQLDNASVLIGILVIFVWYVTRVLSELADYIEAKKETEKVRADMMQEDIRKIKAEADLAELDVEDATKDS